MKEKDEFYVGWQADMPPTTKQFLRKVLWGVLLFVVALTATVVYFQKPFNQHVFEFGQVKSYSGIYFDHPQPMLKVSANQIPAGFSTNILLVGYGKFGARGVIRRLEKGKQSLHQKAAVLRGTLIYGDGKTLLELSDEQEEWIPQKEEAPINFPSLSEAEEVVLTGEILDPKCYFGVMKPGEGKIHKSCAIRCISGGIPPVFRQNTGDAQTPYRYYLLLGPKGEAINKAVLPFVAEQIQIEGQARQFLDWEVLYLDPQAISYR